MSTYEHKIPLNLSCGVNVAMRMAISKWKLCIIQLINEDVKRPKDLYESINGINKRVLQQQLKELESGGIIFKTVYASTPLRVEYYLTQAGKDLLPIISQLEEWGNKHKHLIGE